MKTKHTPGNRCTKCRWVHEADSTTGKRFMGVELCPEHAAAPDMAAALAKMANYYDEGRDPTDSVEDKIHGDARAALAKAGVTP